MTSGRDDGVFVQLSHIGLPVAKFKVRRCCLPLSATGSAGPVSGAIQAAAENVTMMVII